MGTYTKRTVINKDCVADRFCNRENGERMIEFYDRCDNYELGHVGGYIRFKRTQEGPMKISVERVNENSEIVVEFAEGWTSNNDICEKVGEQIIEFLMLERNTDNTVNTEHGTLQPQELVEVLLELINVGLPMDEMKSQKLDGNS